MSKTTNKFSPEVRERAVRMVAEQRAEYGSEWEVMKSIAAMAEPPVASIGSTTIRSRSSTS